MTPDDLDDMAALPPHPKTREQTLAWSGWNQRLYREHGFRLWLLICARPGSSWATAA
jgi:hypothetical protein